MADKASDAGRYLRVPLLGFEIELRTGFLALAAFLLALANTFYQVFGFIRGFSVELFPPPQVLINFADYGNNRKFLRIGARMAYVNSGQTGYNAAIAEERVNFNLGDDAFVQKWQAYQHFDAAGTELVPYYESDAHPVPVNAGSAISHETYFAPSPIRCGEDDAECDAWVNFLGKREVLPRLSEMDALVFGFDAALVGGTSVSTRCSVEVDRDLLANLALKGWDAPPCWVD